MIINRKFFRQKQSNKDIFQKRKNCWIIEEARFMGNFNYDKDKVTFNYRRKRKYLLIFLILVLYFPMKVFYKTIAFQYL